MSLTLSKLCKFPATHSSSVATIQLRFNSKASFSKFSSRAVLLKMTDRKSKSMQCHASSSTVFTEVKSAEKSPVISVDWLYNHLQDAHLKVLDASWYMPFENRNPQQEFVNCHIPGALFFDIDAIVDNSIDLPHMLPTEAAFSASMSALGVKNTDTIVIYDGKGIFSAARAWWMFKVFGHKSVYVLDGGLPQWLARSFPLETTTSEETLSKIQSVKDAVRRADEVWQENSQSYKTTFKGNLVWSLEQVRKNMEEKLVQLVDARSKARFDGIVEEPRKGIRSGHIPGSRCVPFTEVLEGGKLLLPSDILQRKFEDAGVSLEAPIVASCGTGVTACILALALHKLGLENVPVYDGSFTEWGGRDDTPVATNIPE